MNRDQISQIVRRVLKESETAVSVPEFASRPVEAPRSQERMSLPRASRAAVLTGKGRLELREFPIREITGDEMLVRVEGCGICGICGTDVHEFKGDPMGLAPLILGHEGTGEIVRLGAKVRRDSAGREVRLGDRIVTSINACGSCPVNPHHDICAKEITLVGSWVYTVDEYPIAYNFLRRAQGIGLPVESLITHRYPLAQIEEAFETNIRQQGLKVAILPHR